MVRCPFRELKFHDQHGIQPQCRMPDYAASGVATVVITAFSNNSGMFAKLWPTIPGQVFFVRCATKESAIPVNGHTYRVEQRGLNEQMKQRPESAMHDSS